jgi:phosphate:Na+ symporter
VSTQPILDVILAAGVTWAAHSSVAIVLLTMSFAAKGVVPPDAAFALVLGANLGTAINPLLEGGAGDDPAARRLPVGNLINRIVGVAIALAVLPRLGSWLVTVDPDNARVVADFHTGFNVVLALMFFPVLGPFAALLRRLLPTRADPADPSQPLYLDPSAVEVPMVALGAATREALRMADALESMLVGLRDLLQRPDRRQIGPLKRQDDVLDKLNTAIKAYIRLLPAEAMSEADHRRVVEILAFATNLEHAGDVVGSGLLGTIQKQVKRGIPYSAEEVAALSGIVDRLIVNLRAAASLLVTGDDRAAKLLVGEKEAFRAIEADATAAHFEAIREGRADAASIDLDTLRDMKRVNAHLVAAAAYPVLEGKGDLLPSRVR